MLDDFFGGFGAAEDDICATGEPFLVARGHRVAPLLRRELFRAKHHSHAVGEDFGSCARDGTEPGIFQNLDEFVERHAVEFRDADKFNWRKAADFDAQFLRKHFQNVGVIAERNFPVDASLQKNLVGAFGFGFTRLLADLVQAQDVRFGVPRGPAKTAKAASHFANICVVHDTERRVAHAVPGELGVTYGVGSLDDFCPRDIFQDFEPFRFRQSFLVNSFF